MAEVNEKAERLDFQIRINELEQMLFESGKQNGRLLKVRDELKEENKRLVHAGREALATLDEVIDSFPDGKPPHPSIGRVLEGAQELRVVLTGEKYAHDPDMSVRVYNEMNEYLGKLRSENVRLVELLKEARK